MTLITIKRFNLAEYHRLAELGFLSENNLVELIKGEIIEMPPKRTLHSTCCGKLLEELTLLITGLARLRCQDPIIIPPDSQPEPDFVIAKLTDDDYLSSHPQATDLLLVIEVSDSPIDYDQTVKLSLYAEAQINHYWIFNLVNPRLETYSEPYQDLQGNWDYQFKRVFLPNQTVVNLPGFSQICLNLNKVFPM
ncbi:Uma2 family endonuclease [Gloeocapsa sp. PCC 73106]|uniref:Uma2 family endonuclease n=1 Tax=Gloeocapsa sp. PCC 73106 TaxID=102232 RepID=UPI0002ABF498|nr:Uma2 family endonuclease [Gloeocapsa sp. PCC 73106]ELR96368.1 hypothetical protein GLO73106DRAFT_00001600 [Gloeocapsa sp. PCC 73106]